MERRENAQGQREGETWRVREGGRGGNLQSGAYARPQHGFIKRKLLPGYTADRQCVS